MTLPLTKRLFNAGELSPKVYARSDLEKWQAGCKTMLNFVPLPHGGVQRRPGWEYIANAGVNNAAVRLVSFIFSNTQAYVLEFTDRTIRVYMNGAMVMTPGFPLIPYAISTAYLAADLPLLQFTQSYDTLIATHPNYKPREITRTAHDAWSIQDITFTAEPADWGASDYPRTVCFYQDRLIFASSPSYPSRIWASKTSSYYNMTTGTNDSDGLSLNLLSGQSDTIYWLASMKALLAGMDTGIMMITSSTGADGALTPTSKKSIKAQQYGAANVSPVGAGNNLIHTAYPATKIRELEFSWQSDGYMSNDVSIMSEHLFEGITVSQLAYQAYPFEIVWSRMSNGTLVALTYLVEHKVVGWSRHTTPASGSVRSIACIPGAFETELWAAIDRTVNGSVVTYIERLAGFAFSSMSDIYFADSYLSYDGAAIATVTGLSHLEGCQVIYLADGVSGSATVSGGEIALSSAATHVVVGLEYNSDLEPLTPIPSTSDGDLMFHVKRLTEVGFMVRLSAGGEFGPDSDYLSELMDDAALFSGIIPLQSLRGGHDEERSVFIRQSGPLPMCIDCVGYEIEVE